MKTQHEILMKDPEFRRILAIEALVAEASEVIAKLMAEQKLSKADLARRLSKSRAWVTQLLSGRANMTVRTLAEVAYALNGEVKLGARPLSWQSSRKPGSATAGRAGARRNSAKGWSLGEPHRTGIPLESTRVGRRTSSR